MSRSLHLRLGPPRHFIRLQPRRFLLRVFPFHGFVPVRVPPEPGDDVPVVDDVRPGVHGGSFVFGQCDAVEREGHVVVLQVFAVQKRRSDEVQDGRREFVDQFGVLGESARELERSAVVCERAVGAPEAVARELVE